jgi:hypothetical protein
MYRNEIKTQPRQENGQYAEKPISRTKRFKRYVWRKIKWHLYQRPINWLSEKYYYARRNRAIQTLVFLSVAPGCLWLFLSFAFVQFGWHFPEVKAKEVQIAEQKEIQQDSLQQAIDKITTGQQLYNQGLEEKAAIEQKIKELDDQILKGKLGLE